MHPDIIEKFTSLLLSRVEKFRCGSGQDPTVTHGPLVNKAAVDKVHQHVEDALTKGGKLVYGGKPLNVNGKGFFYEPNITNCTKDMMVMTDETFGPHAAIYISVYLRERSDRGCKRHGTWISWLLLLEGY